MKANQVGKEVKWVEPPGKECSECGKKLSYPWGRNDHGNSWVCGSVCQKLYDQRVAMNRHKLAG